MSDRLPVLDHINDQLRRLWRLGRNSVVAWHIDEDAIEVLAVPQYVIPSIFTNYENVLVGSGQIDRDALRTVSDLCEIEPYRINLSSYRADEGLYMSSIESLLRRYRITKIENKAVILFDIVEYSHYSPLEQVAALNSLSYSINISYRRALEHDLKISLGHSTTGDGFYVWNREDGISANVDLFCFMMLVLIDNAVGRTKGMTATVPRLRSCFHIGDCYEYFQADGENPAINSFIVGDVTIEADRMIGNTLPLQIVIGNFLTVASDVAGSGGRSHTLNTVQFLSRAQERLPVVKNVALAREQIREITCYLTGEKESEGHFNIQRYVIKDKHGGHHEVFNAKINCHTRHGSPIYLGIQTQELGAFSYVAKTTIKQTSPLLEEPRDRTGGQAVSDDRRRDSRKTILVVDDDPEVRETAVAMLKNSGFEVLEAENGAAAMTVMQQHETIDLLFTDVVMPGGKSGLDLARFASERQPAIKVLYTSDYGESAISSGDSRGEDFELIAKPYEEDELVDRIRRVLHR